VQWRLSRRTAGTNDPDAKQHDADIDAAPISIHCSTSQAVYQSHAPDGSDEAHQGLEKFLTVSQSRHSFPLRAGVRQPTDVPHDVFA
jgi:hypothetical protein